MLDGSRRELAAARDRPARPAVPVPRVELSAPVAAGSEEPAGVEYARYGEGPAVLLTPHDAAAAFVARLRDARLVDVPTGGHVLVGSVEPLRRLLDDFLG